MTYVCEMGIVRSGCSFSSPPGNLSIKLRWGRDCSLCKADSASRTRSYALQMQIHSNSPEECSALAPELDLAHAAHTITAEIATSLFTPSLESLQNVLVGLDNDQVVFVQILELHHVVLTWGNAGAAVGRSKGEVGGALKLRINAILQSLVGDVQGHHESEDLRGGRCMDFDLQLSGRLDVSREWCSV
jgi:hypothetical protein